MKQEELIEQYNILKTSFSQGDITEKYFLESIDQLRYEDEQGIWHQIDAETGDWLQWEGDRWQTESKPSKAKQTSNPGRSNSNRKQPLPQGFWSLFGLIFANTIKMFFKKLPSTLFFMFLALVLHTFLLVVVNNGFNAENFIGNFLSLSFDPSEGASPLNGIIVWTVVPMIIMSLFAPKSSSPGFGDRLSTIVTYFRVAKKDATAMILGSLGVSLAVGALMNGYSSLVLAAGVGTLFASKSGSVVALLFRSAWTAIFNVARHDNISRYGLAAGYVAIFASSLGFIVNSALTPYGIVIGIILLFIAIIMAKGAPISSAVAPLLIPGLILVSGTFLGLDLLWADDGGFNDPRGGGGNGTLESWWNGTSRNLAILMGILPAIGAGFGPLIQRVLQDMADDLPPDVNRPGGGTLLDENGNPLEQREDGLYGWEVGDETQWLTREKAEEQIQEELDARSRRDQEREEFWEDAQKKSNEWMDKKGEEGLKSQQEMADRLADSKSEPIPIDDNQPVKKVPKEEKSFLGGIWDRVSDGITGLGSDIYNAGKDIYNNPSLLVDTAKNASKEIYDTGAAAVEGTKSLIKGVNDAISDCIKDPSIIWDTAKDTAGDIAGGIKSGMKFAENTAADLGQAARDTYKDPMLAWDTLVGMGSDVKSGATHVKNFVSDPDKVVDTVKSLVGIEDFEKSLDPNNSLVKRLGHVALGVTNIYGAITGISAAGQGVKNGATTLIGRAGAGSLADDAVRLAATTADDVGRASASGAAGSLADDAGRIGSRSIGSADDIARGGSKAAGSADDIARGGSKAAGSTDDTIKAGAGTADDTTKAGAKASKPPEEYPDYIKRREELLKKNDIKNSTIRPGKTTDFAAADTPPDLSGYTEASKKHIQMVADQHGVTIHTRPTNSYAKNLLERGEALSKPELLKNKSINSLDTLLGANSDDLGKVGHFKPKMPQQGTMSDDIFSDVGERYAQRMQEFKDQSSYLANHADEVTVKNGLILDVKTGKPFTGDVDGFAIRGVNGEPLPQAVVDRIQNDLKYGVSGTKLSPGNINHGVHTEWDYSELARNDTTRHITAVADQHGVSISGNTDDGFKFAGLDGEPLPESVANQIERDIKYGVGGTKQSKFDIAKEIDNKIRSSHMADAERAEALVTFTGGSGTEPTSPTSSWWRGGLNGKTLAKDSM